VQSKGRLLSKEELMQKLWPDTFVEEANLTINISAVRKALGDTSGNPQYIETVPKRGYRFVAKVTETEPAKTTAAVEPMTDEQQSLRWIWRRTAVLTALLVIVVVMVIVLVSTRSAKLTDKDTVVLADFTNSTGDPVFDGALRQGLSSQLEQSPF